MTWRGAVLEAKLLQSDNPILHNPVPRADPAGQNPLTFINLLQSLQDVLHGVLIAAPRLTAQLLSLPPAITCTSVHGLLLPPEVSALVEVLEPIHSAALDIAVGVPGVLVNGQTCARF